MFCKGKESVASSTRLRLFQPVKVWLIFNVLAVVLLLTASIGIVTISKKENQRLVRLQLETLIRSRVDDLEHSRYRAFVEGIGTEFGNLFVRIADGDTVFTSGIATSPQVCSSMPFPSSAVSRPLEIDLCRPYHSPVLLFSVLIAAFILCSAVSLKCVSLLEQKTFRTLAEFLEGSGIKISLNEGLLGLLARIQEIKKQLDEARKKEVDVAKAEALSKTAKQVAHDLRGPLTSLQVVRDYFRHLPKKNPQETEHTDLLELSYRRLESTVGDLLDKHRGLSEEKVSFDVHCLLDELLKEYTLQSQLGAVKFSRRFTPGALFIVAQRNRCQRLFGNLVKNAIEAMDGKGTITISTRVEGERAVVTISDSGPGMSEAIIQKITQGEFTHGKRDGHGLGLQMVKEVVADHHGKLTIESTPGRGTAFSIDFPLVKSEVEHVDLPHPSLPLQRGGEKCLNVLVIDDDEGIRLAWKLKRKALGIGELTTFASMEVCEEAKVDYASIDIAFVDKNIPESCWPMNRTIEYLKTQGVKSVVIATGEHGGNSKIPDKLPAISVPQGDVPPFASL